MNDSEEAALQTLGELIQKLDFKMEAQVKQNWIDKLRSGLPQAQGALRNEQGFCCLGVYIEANPDPEWTWGAVFSISSELLQNGVSTVHTAFLPYTWIPSDIQTVFSTFNDVHNLSFDRIADIIDEHIPVI